MSMAEMTFSTFIDALLALVHNNNGEHFSVYCCECELYHLNESGFNIKPLDSSVMVLSNILKCSFYR